MRTSSHLKGFELLSKSSIDKSGQATRLSSKLLPLPLENDLCAFVCRRKSNSVVTNNALGAQNITKRLGQKWLKIFSVILYRNCGENRMPTTSLAVFLSKPALSRWTPGWFGRWTGIKKIWFFLLDSMSTVSSVSGDEKPERKKKKKIFLREKWNYSTTAQPPPHAYAHTAVHVHKHTTTHRYFISYFLVIPKKTPVSIATVGIQATSVGLRCKLLCHVTSSEFYF